MNEWMDPTDTGITVTTVYIYSWCKEKEQDKKSVGFQQHKVEVKGVHIK